MKKLLPVLMLVWQYCSAQSPITFNIGDIPSTGQTQRIAIDSFPLPAINFGSKGANQVYDFSNLTLYKYDTVEYRTPTSGQLSTCPNADVATTADGTNFLLTNTDNANNKLTLEGFEGQLVPGTTLAAAYGTKPDLFRFPTNYQTNFGGTAYLYKRVTGAQVNQPLADSVELTINTTYTDTIDGWGKVITPLGAYKCLRKQRKETTTTLIRAKTFFGWSTVSNTTNTTIRYTYVTKEAKGSVINFNYDTAGVIQSVSWSMNPPEAPVADFSWSNPSGGLVNFTDLSSNYPNSWSWNFGDGSALGSTQNPTHVYSANGTYNVCLTATNAGGSSPQVCKNVVVTGVTASNSAPIAVDDTFSVLQATAIVKKLTTNDLDPNGDSLCVVAVWGTPSVRLNIGGACTDVYYLSDTCFTGYQSFYYSVCDNGSPSLCDTGMVTVNVLQNALYFTTAFFDISSLLHDCVAMSIPNASSNYQSSLWELIDFTTLDSSSYTTNSLSNAPFDNQDFYGEICLTTTGKCNTDKFCDTTAILCSSLDEQIISGIEIYPNPSNDVLRIDMSNNQDAITQNYSAISIVNLMGQRVAESESNNSSVVNIVTSALAPGSYYAIIEGTDGLRRILGRFVIAR